MTTATDAALALAARYARERLLAVVASGQFAEYDGTRGWRERYALGRIELEFNRLARRDVPGMIEALERVQNEREKLDTVR